MKAEKRCTGFLYIRTRSLSMFSRSVLYDSGHPVPITIEGPFTVNARVQSQQRIERKMFRIAAGMIGRRHGAYIKDGKKIGRTG